MQMFLAVSMAVVVAMLGGCTKRGLIWNDWGRPNPADQIIFRGW